MYTTNGEMTSQEKEKIELWPREVSDKALILKKPRIQIFNVK